MGCGKSKIAIDLTCDFNLSPVLILCPLRVVEVWRAQFAQFASVPYEFLALDDRSGTIAEKTERARNALAWATARRKRLAICINYESGRAEPFAHWALINAWPLVIADESHKCKEASSRNSRFLGQLGLRAHYRLALTGTPMAHNPLDIWGQFRFLDPSVLDPTFGSFKLRHAIMGGYYDKEIKGYKELEELNRKFYSIAYRVTDEVLELPPELDQVLTVGLGERAARLYADMERDLLAWIEEGKEVTAANALVRLLRLQQITGGTLKDDEGFEHQVDTRKEDLLEDLLEDLDPDEAVVIFARFRSDLKAIHRAAQKAGRTSAELSGNVDELKLWQTSTSDGPSVLAVQIQAGGVGISLTRARIGIYYSFGFSLTDYVQSRARIHRPPQKRPVVFYHLTIRNSIDEIIEGALERRADLIESVLSEVKGNAVPQ
jgi:SNF2 family DNA or RNA helicase